MERKQGYGFNLGGALCDMDADQDGPCPKMLGHLGVKDHLTAFVDEYADRLSVERIIGAAPVLLEAAKRLIASNGYGEFIGGYASDPGSWSVGVDEMRDLVRAVMLAEGRIAGPFRANVGDVPTWDTVDFTA